MALSTARYLPTATYRLQLHHGFPFAALREIVPYLDDLGVSDCYFSPIFRAAPGSTHGYDVSDPTLVNPELGGEAGLDAAVAALEGRGMGVVLDFVPNHMGIAGPFNHRWLDVLENGQQSRYARFFDIEWYPRHEALRERILVPTLGDYYGKVLERGELKLEYTEGRFGVRYYESLFPLRPESTVTLLDAVVPPGGDPTGRINAVRSFFELLPEPGAGSPDAAYDEREELLAQGRKELDALFADAAFGPALRGMVALHNGRAGEAATFDRLHHLLEAQHYRLAYWKTGAHETNYRRFFAIDTLVGLRVEEAPVLREIHAKVLDLARRKKIRGIRLDHIDGLWDPMQYLHDFQTLFSARAGGEEEPLYVLVEKILEEGERLPSDWPVHGTTGYEFIPQLAGVLVDPAAGAALAETFARFTGVAQAAPDLIYEKKRFVLEELFANAIGNLALGIDHLVEYDRLWRDLTMHDFRVAVRETMACLPVYRTYRRAGTKASEADAAFIRAAYEGAKARNRCLDPVPFEFLRDVLLGEYKEVPAARARGETADGWTLKFQQATGAVMAKSVEDTAFYVYNRLYALNEVGCDPGHFGGDAAAFHELNAARLRDEPQAMLTTSTHDTKTSEDVRARLYTLSERPDHWSELLKKWSTHNRRFKTVVDDRPAPDANEEYLLYQLLLGSWPLDGKPDAAYAERIRTTFRKAISEAKVNSNWIHPHPGWMEAADRFVAALLAPANGFTALFASEAAETARRGMVNSLAQTVLKFTAPGMPDLYQGNEVWDFSLVDPDNRRPIDYTLRRKLLEKAKAASPADLLTDWQDGAIKLHVTRTLLRFRREKPALFQRGDYRPVTAKGKHAEHLVAFTRSHEGQTFLVAVPCRAGKIGVPPLGAAWGDTRLDVALPEGAALDLLSGAPLKERNSPALADLFVVLPCAAVRIG